MASRVSNKVLYFKMEGGNSLETLRWERASSGDNGETWWFFSNATRFSSYNGELREPLVEPQGSPTSIRVASGS